MVHPSVSVVGVSITWDIIMTRALMAYQQGTTVSVHYGWPALYIVLSINSEVLKSLPPGMLSCIAPGLP